MSMQFHILSFEGPDPYAQVGGLGTRVTGLASALAAVGETHLWFVGHPDLPGHEKQDGVHLHRWCQWLSREFPNWLYDGQESKAAEYAASLPIALVQHLGATLSGDDRAVVLAEEWQTAAAVLHLDVLLREQGIRDRVSILWNANNVFGFEAIDWRALEAAAAITTVSRYMKQLMRASDVEATVIHNGLSPDAFGTVDEPSAERLRDRLADRLVLAKIARWDPDKRWLAAIDITARLKREGLRPLLLARGGNEAHGSEILDAAATAGLTVAHRTLTRPGAPGFLSAVQDADDIDVLNLTSHMDWASRRLVFRESAVVLANSGHEPFGLVGLETMAVGGVACTGCSGEDYAVPGHNALVMQTANPAEFLSLFDQMRGEPAEEQALRAAGRETARQYAWPGVIRRSLLPRAQLAWS